MDVTNIANTATSMNEAFIQQASGTAVLKKALDISADNAMALIEAIPENTSAQHLPSHLGQNINTTA
ncbi:Putative motility protein [Nitrosomonas marina]|uniref:Putative motility protein n=1 Tax=Nitrosomonas marina TaxID=917 RepID=A0A1H9Y4U3_9PROT|nr:YjfB family protein [Nitrosomonas marina]SEN41247.1 Putative motility protein [Nitrosomonas marina]SES63862.1 Putative motility protein [Nitrosomonas marina]